MSSRCGCRRAFPHDLITRRYARVWELLDTFAPKNNIKRNKYHPQSCGWGRVMTLAAAPHVRRFHVTRLRGGGVLGHPSNESHVSRSTGTGTWLSCPSICKERSRACFCRTNTRYITVLNTCLPVTAFTESVHSVCHTRRTTGDLSLTLIITRTTTY